MLPLPFSRSISLLHKWSTDRHWPSQTSHFETAFFWAKLCLCVSVLNISIWHLWKVEDLTTTRLFTQTKVVVGDFTRKQTMKLHLPSRRCTGLEGHWILLRNPLFLFTKIALGIDGNCSDSSRRCLSSFQHQGSKVTQYVTTSADGRICLWRSPTAFQILVTF
jgi:hypothetical protein